MFCNQCGKELPDDAMFCPECGAKQEPIAQAPVEPVPVQPVAPTPEVSAQPVAPTPVAPVQPVEPTPAAPTPAPEAVPVMQPVPGAVPAQDPAKKSAFPFKLMIPVAAAAVVLIILLAVLLSGKKGSNYLEYADDTFIYDYNTEVFVNMKGESEEVEDVYSYYTSGNGETTLYITEDSYALYYLSDKLESVKIAEEVCGVWMSLTGEYAAYTVMEDDDYYDTTLYIYNVKSNKSVKIDTGVYARDICVSPSGKAVAYLKDYEGYTDNALYVGGISITSEKVDKDGCYPVAISDNAKSFYYINDDYKLYYFNGKETDKIETEVDGGIYANSKVSEIMFAKNGKTYYYNPKMEEPEKVAGEAIDSWCEPGNGGPTVSMESDRGEVIGKESLKDMVFEAGGYLYWMNTKGNEAIKIVTSSYLSAYQLSEDGHSLMYINSGDLCKVAKFDKDMKSTVLYDDEYLDYFIASEDLSKIYVVTDEDELYYYKSKKKLEKISSDFEYDYDNIAYNEASKKVCYIEDDDLYEAATTGKSKKVVMEEVSSVYSGLGGILFYAYNEDEDTRSCYFMDKKAPKELWVVEY